MKTKVVHFLLSLLTLSSILPFTETTSARNVPLIYLPTETPQKIPKQFAIHLWHDANGDLWIATPFYTWNITGGKSISVSSGSLEYKWLANENSANDRVVDRLFLASQPEGPITTRVIFALPDEALIYLERPVFDGIEGLELSFRASDGLIRLTHRWQGENTPPRRSSWPIFAIANKRASMVMMGTLSPDDEALLPNQYDYSASFNPDIQQGYAILKHPDAPESSQYTQSPYPNAFSTSTMTAQDYCQFPDFFLPGQVLGTEYLFFYSTDSNAPLQRVEILVRRLQLALPDLDVASIMRVPRYDYDAAKNQPVVGDSVTFVARVANRGNQSTGSFTYNWRIDNTVIEGNVHPSLSPGDLITLTRNWTWQTGVHTVTLELDTGNLITEVSEQNNKVDDQINALAVGFWVEQSVYDYFNLHQVELGLGSTSWDDWAQRQLRVWNQMFADAVHPLTPQGIIDRVRLDKVTVVPDGALPSCATNFPDPNDKTIDLEWGFPSELVGIPSGHTCGGLNHYFEHPETQEVEYSLMHELSHARYLVDLYGLNVAVSVRRLSANIDSTSSTIILDQDVESDDIFVVPAYLAIGGELVICQTRSGNTFADCSRGAEGTTPRPHAYGTLVNLAMVRLQDGAGNLIQGSSALPLIGLDDHLYYNRYLDDLMSGGLIYEQHSAFAWNRIAGRRPVCGNYNAPCNIGEYLRDLPQHNILEIHGASGQPLFGARVELHQPRSYPVTYGKVFIKDPDSTYFTDSQGRFDLGGSPFGDLSTDVGPHKGLILLKITSSGESYYRFFEITQANEAYWFGQQDRATYVVTTTLQQGSVPQQVFLPIAFRSYPSVPVHTLTFTSQASDGEVGNIDCLSWNQCRNASQGNFVLTNGAGATVAAWYDSGRYEAKRVFFYFDTSALPINSTIQSAKLSFFAGPFQKGTTRRVHVVSSSQGTPLTNSDFSRIGFISGAYADLTPNTWRQVPLNRTGLTWITKGGATRVALIHDLDLNNITPITTNDSLVSMSEDLEHQPYLTVQYTVP